MHDDPPGPYPTPPNNPSTPPQGYEAYGPYGWPGYGYGYSHPHPDPHTAQATTGHRHAGLGIASFIIGVIALLMICGGFGGVFIIILRDPALVQAAQSIKPGDTTIPPAVVPLIIANCVMLSGMGVALIGVVLGATSFAIPNRKPLWPILGTCLNAVILLATTFILLLGFVAG